MSDSLREVAARIAFHLEEQAAADGWDRPACLYEIHPADTERVLELTDLELGSDMIAISFAAVPVCELDDHPAEALVGRHVSSDEVLGVALITEGWDYPPEVLRALSERKVDRDALPSPANHPDRVEVRLVHALFRDGTTTVVVRRRGQDPEEVPFDRLTGRLVRALRRYLRLPSDDLPRFPPRTVLAHMVAEAGVQALSKRMTFHPDIRALVASRTAVADSPAAGPAFQILAAPLAMPAMLEAFALARTSWEGFCGTLVELAKKVAAEPGLKMRDEDRARLRRWLTRLEWGDDALAAWDVVERLALSDDAGPKQALQMFNTATAGQELTDSQVEIVRLYRQWLEALTS